MKKFAGLFLIFLIESVVCDDGLCGIEPPKEGESCSGSSSTTDDEEASKDSILKYDYEEKLMTQEEKDIWDKRFYSKKHYTNNIDWPHRNELDIAEEWGTKDVDKGIELFDEIVKKEPTSTRAIYFKYRFMENKLVDSELDHDSEEFKSQLNSIFDKYLELMDKYEPTEKVEEALIMPVIFGSILHHSMGIADRFNMTSRSIEFMEKAMTLDKNQLETERQHVILVHYYLAANDLAKAEKALETALEYLPNSTYLQFFKGIVLKATGRKMEANKILRSLDADKTNIQQFCHETNNFANFLFNNGLDSLARLMFKEVSKLHVFKSEYQRLVLPVEKQLDSKDLIFDLENDVGLSTYDEEIQELTEFLPKLKEEALKAAENVTKENWYKRVYVNMAQGNYVVKGGGNFSVLPLFTYGKRRHANCKELMPETCQFMKKNFDRPTKLHIGTVKLTVLDPKTKTLPLEGVTDMRVRLIVPLQIPTGFKIVLRQDTEVPLDKMVVIDDSYEKVFDNQEGKEAAIWLSIDLAHPEISAEELKNLSITPYAKNFFLMF